MNWNYIAGFFDGEGSICQLKFGKHKRVRFYVSISNTDYKVLKEIQKFAKVGNVYKCTDRNPRWKPCWQYMINSHVDIVYFINHIVKRSLVKKKSLVEKRKSLLKYQEARRLTRKKFVDKYEKRIRRNFRRGISISELARKVGLSRPSVRIYLKKMNMGL